MLECQDKVIQDVAACTCDRCLRRMTPDDPGWHERLSVAFRGGFDSIFGDGCEIEIDLCQQCVKETLGAWLRISPPELADAPIEALKGMVRKPDRPVAVEDMTRPASDCAAQSVATTTRPIPSGRPIASHREYHHRGTRGSPFHREKRDRDKPARRPQCGPGNRG